MQTRNCHANANAHANANGIPTKAHSLLVVEVWGWGWGWGWGHKQYVPLKILLKSCLTWHPTMYQVCINNNKDMTEMATFRLHFFSLHIIIIPRGILVVVTLLNI